MSHTGGVDWEWYSIYHTMALCTRENCKRSGEMESNGTNTERQTPYHKYGDWWENSIFDPRVEGMPKEVEDTLIKTEHIFFLGWKKSESRS
jgi:hypothetical protein